VKSTQKLYAAFRLSDWISRSGAVVVKAPRVAMAGGAGSNWQDPIRGCREAIVGGAPETQSAQAIGAAYDFDLPARDHSLADGAIALLVERAPWPALVKPAQSNELIFCGESNRGRGRKHAADDSKFRRDWQ